MNHTQRTLYLDTMLWNELCDLKVEPNRLLPGLSARGINLVLSAHVIVELARTFKSVRSAATERGKTLFGYLLPMVSGRLRCIRQTPDLLRSEIRFVARDDSSIEQYYEGADHAALQEEVRKLSEGVFDKRADSFITKKRQDVADFRLQSSTDFKTNNHAMSKYANLSAAEFIYATLPRWGRQILKIEIARQYPRVQESRITWLAKKLLSSKKYRISNALVRSHLYVNWRLFQSSNVPRDLLDDCYHVVNAACCDLYATKEAQQGEYASILLSKTSVATYDKSQPLFNWLCSL